MKTKFIVIIVTLFLFTFFAYQFRHRPSRKLNAFIKANTPSMQTKEGKIILNKAIKEITECFDYVMYSNPTPEAFTAFISKNKFTIMTSNVNDIAEKNNVVNITDQQALKESIPKFMDYYMQVKHDYTYGINNWEKRNAFAKFFFL